GKVSTRPWLETDWILGSFSKRRKIAILKYIDFVRDGIGLPSLWVNLQNQIFLGTEKFVNKKKNLINKKGSLNEVPRLHRRKIPKPLEYYERKYKDQRQAIYNAYISGGYTLKEIGDHFQKHYSTISRIVKDNE
ncbi:MAG: helix-turn-helix domain-containing protein, partial [Gammaproteobacteria bacterium]|nr:helix-turn-helix domain-containing protein [Gammaproteobacteria bacterium]